MNIQTERLWLLGAKNKEESRSGTMVFSNNEKRDAVYSEFIKALDEWATPCGRNQNTGLKRGGKGQSYLILVEKK